MRRARIDRGSTLLFFPAALLVVVVLAAITVDLTAVHLAHRQAADLAAATAGDAVTVGLDEAALRAGAGYRLDPVVVDRLAQNRIRTFPPSMLGRPRVHARLPDDRSVEVTVSGRVRLGFAEVIPGAVGDLAVEARATAVATSR